MGESSTEQAHSSVTDLVELTLPDPLDLLHNDFNKVALLGVGLIGGSVGMKLKAMDFSGTVVGYDRQEVLDEALMRGAIDQGAGDISEAIAGAELIVLAMEAEEVEKVLPTILRTAAPHAVVTDTVGAKAEIVRIARGVKDARAVFIGGHPLAGSQRPGIANAHPELFASAYWLLTPENSVPIERLTALKWWIRMIGAYPIVLPHDVHDKIIASTTHMPLIFALALSDWLASESREVPLMQKLATGHFQGMTALAALPSTVWESILKANREEIQRALKSFREHFQEIEALFATGKLEDVWQRAYSFQRKLARERPGDWDSQSELTVIVPDRPGTLATIAGLLAEHNINIRDIGVIHARERQGGLLRVTLESLSDSRNAIQILKLHGYTAMRRD
ncbi:MAG: prephenate dehydrogenase/arogenate dehydrogenase family protein [Calditrichaeota bacterium]|nr:prephenate dehydrogenase/arogenate dehydrogenase family protein [Calditrichota bacterium]MCB9367868.1 prephenate dehydrogenase/arogenate dehydrogenase family protein [Calditrichota bacterium]